jgi:tetratricopeptide (TPR) repeat protein
MKRCLRKANLGVLFLWAFLPYASAQQGSTGGSTGTATTAPRRDVAPSRPTYPSTQASPQTQQQPPAQMIFLSGSVVRDDGSAPPYGAVIELDCGGSITREAIVGLNGRFSFQIGGDNRFGQVFPDASQRMDSYPNEMDSITRESSGSGFSGSMPQRYKRVLGCELRAQLSGYRSTSLYIKEEPMSGPNELGTIVVYSRDRVLGNMVSLTNLLAPKAAKKSLEQGQKAVSKQRFSEAEAHFKSAIQEYPKYAEAWFDLGLIYEHQERPDKANEAYSEAVKADKLYVRPYVRQAYLAYARQNWREAADLAEKALALDPVTLVESYFVSALSNLNIGELDLAEKRAREGQRMDFSKRFPQFYLILANVFMLRQDTAGSARELRSYLRFAPNASNANLVRSRLQKLEDQGKAVEPQAAGGGH